MTAEPLFDTLIALCAIGLLINVGSLVAILVVGFLETRRSILPRAVARLP